MSVYLVECLLLHAASSRVKVRSRLVGWWLCTRICATFFRCHCTTPSKLKNKTLIRQQQSINKWHFYTLCTPVCKSASEIVGVARAVSHLFRFRGVRSKFCPSDYQFSVVLALVMTHNYSMAISHLFLFNFLGNNVKCSIYDPYGWVHFVPYDEPVSEYGLTSRPKHRSFIKGKIFTGYIAHPTVSKH